MTPALPSLSLVIPARNEERFLAATLAAASRAAQCYRGGGGRAELVLADNASTDATARLARAAGAHVVREERRSIAAVRNAGAAAARGDVLVFCDADTVISPNLLLEAGRAIGSGRYAGGGLLRVRLERTSPGIVTSALLLAPLLLRHRIAGAVLWASRRAFDAIGGFDPALLVAEDLEFALRLKRHARAHRLRFGVLPRASAVTSSRRVDALGDWFLLRNPRILRDVYRLRVRAEDAWRTHYAGR